MIESSDLQPKGLMPTPPSNKMCFMYCGDDLCDCHAHPRHHGRLSDFLSNRDTDTDSSPEDVKNPESD